MGAKQEIQSAKERIYQLRREQCSLQEIATRLNVEYEGFYFVRSQSIWRENTPDYLPAVKVW